MKKKILAVIMAAILLIGTLSACGSKPEENRSFGDKVTRNTLHVCVDTSLGLSDTDELTKRYFTKLSEEIKTACGIEKITFELVPQTGADREAALQRLRTEIMAGTGPDLFLMSTVVNGSGLNIRDALFTFPEKNMEAGLFLPLDEYMENNTRFTDWDKQTQTVMQAGRNSEGQVIIPLTYTFQVLVFPESQVNIPFTTDLTMQEILDDPETREIGALMYSYLYRSDPEDLSTGINLRHLSTVLGKLADYEKEELLFTEEELFDIQTNVFSLYEAAQAQCEFQFMKTDITERDFFYELHTAYFDEEMAIAPIYSRNGGVTASITAFAAVNRNTKLPKEAFTVLDYLMRENCQRNSELFSNYFSNGIPMQNDLGQEGKSLYEFGREGYVLDHAQFEDLLAIKEQITAVNFDTELDFVLKDLIYKSIFENKSIVSPEAVSDGYDKMKRMMGE